jgi:hypothetical protein
MLSIASLLVVVALAVQRLFLDFVFVRIVFSAI